MLPKSEVNERKWSETSTNVTDFQVATKARPRRGGAGEAKPGIWMCE